VVIQIQTMQGANWIGKAPMTLAIYLAQV